ncbi:hypothetical protein [Carboxylicivirga caseinilyticus]|uniref:hypothetical protein n=1 Tax=Carboxylicivirga caseinilyticus TaxID=3417572 RepID=UPI003D3327AA|nr:hypothetical protein [Marinilabiliaceae bacterium A049]
MKPTFLILSIVYICASCATPHKVIPKLPSVAIDNIKFNSSDSLYYGYFEDILQKSDNKRLQRWAKRKNYSLIGFEVTNASTEFTKGYQLKYYYQGKKLTPIRNEWVAKKARQKINGLGLLAIPLGLIEMIFRDATYENLDIDIGEGAPSSMRMAEINNQNRKEANRQLLNNLVNLEISDKVLKKGVPIYAVMVLEGEIDLSELEIRK